MRLFQVLKKTYLELFPEAPRNEQRISEIIQQYYWIHDIQKLTSIFNETFMPKLNYQVFTIIFKWLFFHIYWKRKTLEHSNLDMGSYNFLAKMYLHQAHSKLCKDWNLCERIRGGEFTDEMRLALSIQEVLSDERSVVAAAFIVKFGAKEFCGCDKQSSD